MTANDVSEEASGVREGDQITWAALDGVAVVRLVGEFGLRTVTS